MGSTSKLKTNFAVCKKFDPFYVAGKIEISSDGKIFSSAGNALKVFDPATGQVERTIQTDELDLITVFTLNPVTQNLFTASKSLLVKEWDVNQGSCIKTWKAVHRAPVVSMCFDPLGQMLATGSGDSTVKIWHSASKCHTHSFRGSQGVVSVLKFHPDHSKQRLFSAADADYIIRVWNLNPSKQLAELKGHFSAVTDIQIAAGMDQLISAGRDKVLIVWDLRKFLQIKTLPVFEEIENFIILPSQNYPEFGADNGALNILCGGSRGYLSVWDISNSRLIFPSDRSVPRQTIEESNRIQQICLSDGLDKLFVVLVDQSILVYDFPALTVEVQFSGFNDKIYDIKFLDNENFAVVATNSQRLKVYELCTTHCVFGEGHTDMVLCVAVVPESGLIISGSKDNNIRIWTFDAKKKKIKCVAVATGHTSSVGALVASRSSSRPFFISGSEDSTIKMWHLRVEKEGKRSACSAEAVHTEVAHENGINSLAISPDAKWVASAASDKTAKVWKKEPFQLKGVLRGHRRPVWCVLFAPHDQIIGTSSGDGSIRLWALSSLTCVKTFEGHDCSVMKFIFLSRGLQILSSGSDGLLKLWDVRKNTCVKTFDEHENKVWTMCVSDSEHRILTGAEDSVFLMWSDITEQEHEEERKKLDTFILQEQELTNLLDMNEYGKAFKLALNLDQPNRLLKIITEILEKAHHNEDLHSIIRALEHNQIEKLLMYIMAWNTNSKHTFAAQTTLACIFSSVHPKDLLKFSKIKTIVEGLLPYTERHASRLDQLNVNALFFKYVWNNVKELSEV
ncbi:transducin beta-like protein 3 [Paramacrobiotus metropolitanus]|uniref:transducin beta-like protein 3 n=1 Tax=Paramacrobiotus metropolitanus TaxID=2943436 RepID=UPI00244621F1|nr:transducin beta-like protein 3 [Paramacrobiotus metropolitanus]